MKRRGLVLGRFQPFHKGHIFLIEEAKEQNDEVIVIVGSAQLSHTPDNPFTAGERVEMIWNYFDSKRSITVIPVMDINRYALYAKHIESLVPAFSNIYTGNPVVKALFQDAGYSIGHIQLKNRDTYSGSIIRDQMLHNDDAWKHSVPETTVEVIKRINGINRIINYEVKKE